MTELFHVLKDDRGDCDSILVSMTVKSFLGLVEQVYKDKGGIEGQRPALQSKTARTIRARLVEDLQEGAVIPPIVLGILADSRLRREIGTAKNTTSLLELLQDIDEADLSIIDGMQRTTALLEASEQNKTLLRRKIRVEFWVAQNLGTLVYRMLVLNSGQIPWEISRQLETIYSQLISLIQKKNPGAEIFLKDEGQRRRAPGEYQASTVVRLFLAFSARRAEFDVKDRVAQDFARIDAIEASSHNDFVDYFVRTFALMVKLDHAFSRAKKPSNLSTARIADGRKIFKAETALIGFFVAVSIQLFDEPGFQPDWNNAAAKMTKVEQTLTEFANKLNKMKDDEVDEFLQLDTLNDRLDQRAGQIGRFERDLFVRAFSFLIERSKTLPDMEPCWLK